MLLTERAKIEALNTPWWSKHLATGSQELQHCLSVVVRLFLYPRGSTGNKQFGPESGRGISQNGLTGLGTCTKGNLLDLTERDKRVSVVHHVAELNI